MSVSMLLNAANVVTAAERCHAIDEKTGRIPIQFLLSRSNDLDDAVKDQLQQLAASSPSISIVADRDAPPDHVMTDVPPPPPPDDRRISTETNLGSIRDDDHSDDFEDDRDDDDDDDEEEEAVAADDLELHPSSSANEEEEALKDIDRETRTRPDRKMMDRKDKRNQTLTRKAIRKHTGGKKANKKDNKAAMESGGGGGGGVLGGGGGGAMDSVPMSVDGSTSTNSNTPRRRWKEWEDELLIQVVSEHGPTRWNTLARHFPGRNGRQVRLRWMNHLQPSLDKRPWRPEEDAVLLEAHKALGNKWALISMRLGGRTDNSVKNRYKSIVRRSIREAKAARKQE